MPTPRASRASSTSGSLDELREALGDDADAAIEYFGAQPAGNFEGSNILTRGAGEPDGLDSIRERLYDVRSKRVWPGLDDKRMTSWNALMISALADAGAVLGRADYLEAAGACASFVLGSMRGPDGRLLRTWKDGEAKLNGYLEDHAYLVEALLTLYEATFDPRWFVAARETGGLHPSSTSPTTSAAASSRPPTTTSGSSRGARTSRTTRSRPATRAWRTGCCGWRR